MACVYHFNVYGPRHSSQTCQEKPSPRRRKIYDVCDTLATSTCAMFGDITRYGPNLTFHSRPTPYFPLESEYVTYDESSEDEEEIPLRKCSRSMVEFLNRREAGPSRLRPSNFDEQFALHHLITHNNLRETTLPLGGINKIFCSQWLSDRLVVFGTKCNKLMVVDIYNKNMTQIPMLKSRVESPVVVEPECGIHSIQMNPSRTLLATGAVNTNDVAIYKLPSMDPLCVGEAAHTDWIFDCCWLDDEYLVTGSRDSFLALWKAPQSDCSDNSVSDDGGYSSGSSQGSDSPERVSLPTYRSIQPTHFRRCRKAEKIRALVFNPHFREIVALSLNSHLHILDATRLSQKLSKPLAYTQENVCLKGNFEYGFYAVGSKACVTLFDQRTISAMKRIPLSYQESSVRSISCLGDMITIGTGVGVLLFFDIRADKFLEQSEPPIVSEKNGNPVRKVIYPNVPANPTNHLVAPSALALRLREYRSQYSSTVRANIIRRITRERRNGGGGIPRPTANLLTASLPVPSSVAAGPSREYQNPPTVIINNNPYPLYVQQACISTSPGVVFPDETFVEYYHTSDYSPALYTHQYDPSGTKLFLAGGPLPASMAGYYAAVWQ